jgi:hypothetical protein
MCELALSKNGDGAVVAFCRWEDIRQKGIRKYLVLFL